MIMLNLVTSLCMLKKLAVAVCTAVALKLLYFSSNDDSKEGNEISPWKMYKHIQIKPQPTDLPKPKIARSGGGRNVHFTDEWKQYATAVYPIDPSRYWNLPQAQYDLLIPVNNIV